MVTDLTESLGVGVDIRSPRDLWCQDTGIILDCFVVWRFRGDGVGGILGTLGLSGSTLLVYPLVVTLLVEVGGSRLAALGHHAAPGNFLARQDLGVGEGDGGQESRGGEGVELHGCGIVVVVS